MSAIKISCKVKKSVWNEPKALTDESHQYISGLLTEAIQDYVRRRRLRPEVIKHLEKSIRADEKPGRLLAQ